MKHTQSVPMSGSTMDSMFSKRFSTFWVAGRREVLDGFETVIKWQQATGSVHTFPPAPSSWETVSHDWTGSSQKKTMSMPSVPGTIPIQPDGERL